MIEVRLTTSSSVLTAQFDAPGENRIVEFQMCLYCEQNPVQLPKKFCRSAHRVAYCQKGIKDLTPSVSTRSSLSLKTPA